MTSIVEAGHAAQSRNALKVATGLAGHGRGGHADGVAGRFPARGPDRHGAADLARATVNWMRLRFCRQCVVRSRSMRRLSLPTAGSERVHFADTFSALIIRQHAVGDHARPAETGAASEPRKWT